MTADAFKHHFYFLIFRPINWASQFHITYSVKAVGVHCVVTVPKSHLEVFSVCWEIPTWGILTIKRKRLVLLAIVRACVPSCDFSCPREKLIYLMKVILMVFNLLQIHESAPQGRRKFTCLFCITFLIELQHIWQWLTQRAGICRKRWWPILNLLSLKFMYIPKN